MSERGVKLKYYIIGVAQDPDRFRCRQIPDDGKDHLFFPSTLTPADTQ